MTTVAEVAGIWNSVGVSTIPVRSDGTKRPAIKWAPYQISIPSLTEISQWWANGHADLGLALICGKVSGNLEMTELEASATSSDCLIDIQNELDALGVGFLWEQLTNSGSYMEWTPSGGIHFLYRLEGEVPGNTKIANDENGKVLAETRGEGGYVIVAPTSGLVHPTGESWSMAPGANYGHLVTLSIEMRNLFHLAIKRALDKTPEPAPPVIQPVPRAMVSVPGNRPGDAWAAVTDWDEILEPAGWQLSHRVGQESYWVRPGKRRVDGHSATTNYQGSEVFKLFSSSVPGLDPDATYTKFGLYAALNHGGDLRAATLELAGRGFGEHQLGVATMDTISLEAPQQAEVVDLDEDPNLYTLDEVGTAQRLWRQTKKTFRYIHEEKCFYHWDSRVWIKDTKGALSREIMRLTDTMMAQAKTTQFEPLDKWARKCRSDSRITAVKRLVRDMPGATMDAADFDPDRHLLNLRNGILDLETGELHQHDPGYLMTRMFGASYDQEATCPRFEQFMTEVLPDAGMRAYVQRAMGYTLLGDADQRSLFLIYGPSGTGKSQFVELMRMLFGEYGAAAPSGTFKSSKDKINNDLHRLKGKRFVTTSETADNAIFDEDLLKRITGRDQVSSRELYESYQDWTPECSVWIATNHPPKFNSDDDAIWSRAKLVPFITQFTAKDSPIKAIPDLARKVLVKEADGILNWMLAGLRDYLANGLQEPDQVTSAAHSLREESDGVLRFIEDQLADGILELEPTASIPTRELYNMYVEWGKTSGERPLGSRRFIRRLESGRPDVMYSKRGRNHVWIGLFRRSTASVLGTFQIPSTR